MRLLITGLAGYLGRHVARVATAHGWEVAGTVHTTPAADLEWRALPVDVRDAPGVRTAVRAARPDAVVHTAYRMGEDERAWSINVGGARAVAAAAADAGARLVHLSTDVVFGDGERPWSEENMPGPVTAYGESKLEAERACGRDALIVRTSLLYGGERPSPHEVAAIEAADGARDMAFFTDEVRCPIAVGDLADALLELAASDVVGPLHVAGADAVDRLEFARLVAARHGRDPNALRGGVGGPGRPKRLALDCSRARAILRTRLRGAREVLGGVLGL
jgi:dTDP-4-dehydrorhamnose reductase